MASTVNGVKAKAAKEDVILTEYDIPGAILPGAILSMKKSALVNR